MNTDKETMLTQKEVAEWLGVTTRTIRKWQKRESIPRVKIGRKVYYPPKAVYAHLIKHFGIGFVAGLAIAAAISAAPPLPPPDSLKKKNGKPRSKASKGAKTKHNPTLKPATKT